MEKADALPHHPNAYRTARLPGTRALLVHPHYIPVYRSDEGAITILRLLHSARNWP